jgi:hypothetical protein
MIHFLERFFTRMRREFGETPILLHLGMQEVLVDCGQFTRQLLVEKLENVGIALHFIAPVTP